jgi:hypothetical protein
MPRPTSRARLECGARLNINSLVRSGAIQSGALVESRATWSNNYSGELMAIVEANKSGAEGWFRIQIAEINLDQRINLVSLPRHFGAAELEKRKVETPRGGAWHPQLVSRIVQR